ncbi:hypothetical protein [Paenibacillus sedimenti]|uniref:Uncharacterized protein n=1 Tax=Paenibacillus sedimenti TaxID=2770274 RepID=A0A926KZA5_9BACL|nr:hypothetical protein [Paenibacillus sedimenti]MBD0384869.1 hypothetical protein [Paenibacillus sedimenti]
MKNITLLVILIFVNLLSYEIYGISGLLIFNFAVISTILIMIYDKIGKNTNKRNRRTNIQEQELKKQITELEESKKEFEERDLPNKKDLVELSKKISD